MKLRDKLRYYKHLLAAKEHPAEWYDSVYAESEEYRQSHRDSVYLPVWRAIAGRLRAAGVTSVLDLGCGPGQLAAFLLEEGVGRYTGVDFSATAIDIARARCPRLTFLVADLKDFGGFDVEATTTTNGATLYVFGGVRG